MFLYKNLSSLLAKAKTLLEESGVTKKTFLDIEDGHYRVAVSFNRKKEWLCYEAFDVQNGIFSDTPYIAIFVDSSGKVYSTSNGSGSYLTYQEKGLFCFVTYLDKKLSEEGEEKLRKFYAPVLSDIAPLLNLNEKEREERREIRQDFLDFMQAKESPSLEKEEYIPTSLLDLSVSVHNDSGTPVLTFDVYEGEKRLFSPRTLATFFMDLSEQSFYNLGKKNLKLSFSLFSEKNKNVLSFLSSAFFTASDRYYSYRGNEIPLSISSFNRFLNLYSGENIFFQGQSYYISNDTQEAKVVLQESGNVLLSPSPKALEGMMFYLDGTHLLLFNSNSAILERFYFQNAKLGKLYSFFLKNPNASTKLLGDLLLPYVQEIDVQGDNNSLKINFYVDINDKGELLFHTDYLVFDEVRGYAELKDNVYYASRIARFQKELGFLGIPEEGTLKDDSKILSFLKRDLTSLKKTCRLLLSERLGKTKVSHVGGFDIHLERNVDWLSVKVKSKEYSDAELQKILKAYQAKKKFILLRDKAILLEEKEVEELSKLSKNLHLDDRFINDDIPLYEAFNLKNSDSESHVTYGDFVTKFIDDILSFEKRDVSLSENLRKTLRPYQLHAVKWLDALYENKMGAILADDMGLGKTLETIAFLSLPKERKKPSLIIVPKSVLYNWKDEIERFVPSLKVSLLDGSKEERLLLIKEMKEEKEGVYVVSYDSLRNDSEHYEGIEFDAIVCDEAQTIKNAAALKSKAIKRLKGSFRLALTGTPIENSMADLWAIFDFLMPGYLRTLPIFKTTYVMAGNQEEARRILSKKIQPFLLRRTKDEVLKELPPKTVERISIPMDEESQAFYLATLQEARAKQKQMRASPHEKGPSDRYASSFSMLPILTKLREICVDPIAFFDGFTTPSAKLSYAVGLVKDGVLGGHKILVFSAFTKVLSHFSYLLLDEGIASYTIEGDVASKKRIALAKKFNEEDGTKVMLVSLKAGGTGLNLQGADIVIHLDPWWNFAAEEQATDRAYRLGQKRPVTVYKLYCRKSIEEKVLELQDSKKELYDSLIHSSSSFLSTLSEEDLDFLLN